jgi:hypothetical protein
MKEFSIPLLSVSLAQNTDAALSDNDVDGIELEYEWPKYAGRNLFTGVFIAAGTDGLGISFCAELPRNSFFAPYTAPKSRVFENDCLEIFLRPFDTTTNKPSSLYYGWEINTSGACLDYRAGVGEEGLSFLESLSEFQNRPIFDPTSPIVSGKLYDVIAEKKITFDYDWKSQITKTINVEDEFWYLEVFIPWTDFGLTEAPKKGTKWTGTFNRIDETARILAAKKSSVKTPQPGLQSLIEDTSWPRFHQPEHFALFTFI